MRLSRVSIVVLICAQVLSPVANAIGAEPATSGPGPSPLRIGSPGAVNFNLAFIDSATGDLRGVGADLARALAGQMGLALEPIVYVNTPAVLAAANEDAWDVSVQPAEQARAAGVLYAGSYLLVQQTYLVAEDSPFETVEDLDQPGVRIIANRNAPADSQLTRLLENAELIRSDAVGTAAAGPLFAGEAEAYAFNREGLLTLAEQRPGFRVLVDDFAVTELGIALPRGNESLARTVRQFLEDAKASGLVQRAVDANGVRGVRVADPGQ